MNTNVIELDAPSLGVETNEQILRGVLNALNEAKVSDAIDEFDEHFSFNDHALDPEFTQKSRETSPIITVEVKSISGVWGDHVVAKWKLTASQFGRKPCDERFAIAAHPVRLPCK
jgi:hypothetical protein